jgi:hypothetical protein
MPSPAGSLPPISFAPYLLAAVRAGYKTVTRRRIAHAGLQAHPAGYTFLGMRGQQARFSNLAPGSTGEESVSCPFGQPGDWLPVLEAPELALRIRQVRAEPVRLLSEAEALAEGIVAYAPAADGVRQYGVYGTSAAPPLQATAVAAFQALLSTFYPTAWARNEWVWVVEFACAAQLSQPQQAGF